MDWYTIFWKQWRIFKRRFWKIFSSSLINPLLFLVVFGWGLGRSTIVEGESYLQFVVPGIIALTLMTVSFNAVAAPLNISRIYFKTYEEYIIAPINSASVVLGEVLAGCGRGIFAAVIVLVLGLLSGAELNLGLLFWVVMALNSFMFASLGVVAAMVINTHEDMGTFTSFVIVPMSFLSNTFFSLKDVPVGVSYIINLLPLTHASQALRAVALDNPFPWLSLWILVAFSIIFFWVAVRVSLRVE
jgi:ABC-type multidrug transport system permease subunit